MLCYDACGRVAGGRVSRRIELTVTPATASVKRYTATLVGGRLDYCPRRSARPRSQLPPDARGLVHLRVFAEVRHDLLREELHQLERPLVGPAVHGRAENPRLELVGKDTQLVAHGRGGARRQ